MTKLNDRFRQAREARGYTVARLSGETGVSESAIRRIEQHKNPNPYMTTVQAIANVLHVRPAWLVCWSDKMSD